MKLAEQLYQRAIEQHDAMWRRAWAHQVVIDIEEWAEQHVSLRIGESSIMGPYRFDRAPHLRALARDLSPSSPVTRMAVMGSRQMMKSTLVKLLIGHAAHITPCTIMVVQPTLEQARKYSKRVLAPMIMDTDVLRERFRPPKSRDSKNTVLMKEMDDGLIVLAGGNSSASLRGLSARIVIIDESNEYKRDVDGQGDPFKIAEKCAANFPDRKVVYLGNPGIRGHSRCEDLYREGNQQRRYIRCPFCKFLALLTWDGREWFSSKLDSPAPHHRIAFDKKKGKSGKLDPKTAHMVCGNPKCRKRVEEHHKSWMLDDANAEWIATGEGDGETESYQLSSLYSPLGFQKWSQLGTEYFRAEKEGIEGLRNWVNDVLGESYEGESDQAAAADLRARFERYDAEVPRGVGVLTAGVDVQKNRLIYLIYGWGEGEESWVIEWAELLGDPEKDEVWKKLDEVLLQRKFKHASGRLMKVERVCVDSGGKKGHPDRVYQYCGARLERGVFAVKGGKEKNKPLVGMPSFHNIHKTPLYVLCTDTGKARIMKRLANLKKPEPDVPSPGFIHMPEMSDERNEEFALQMTSEYAVWTKTGRKWEEIYANHAWDCSVYALAALYIAGDHVIATLGDRARKLGEEMTAEERAAAAAPAPAVPTPSPFARRPRGRWSGWRR